MSETDGFWADIVPRVEPESCLRCADCAPVAVCLAQAIRREQPNSLPVVDDDRCFGCYSCSGACPHGAVILPVAR